MGVTIKDVAKKAGYSVTTVSRALNGYDDVNENTRKKIFQVARELNYRPNRIAQNLVSRKFNTIGMFVLARETFKQEFIFEIQSGILDQISEQNFDLLLFGDQELKSNLEQICTQRGVGGAVILGLRVDNPIVEELAQLNFPVILIDIPIEGQRAGFVTSDNRDGISQALDYLYQLGHRQIGLINGHEGAWVSKERLMGYQQALNRLSLSYVEDLVTVGDFSKKSGRRAARLLIENNPQMTAICAVSDLMAAGAMEELMAAGYDIPGDISIIGFDDQLFAPHTTPALTTVRQNKYQMGVVAAEELVAMIEDVDYKPELRTLPTKLVIRSSTAKVRD